MGRRFFLGFFQLKVRKHLRFLRPLLQCYIMHLWKNYMHVKWNCALKMYHIMLFCNILHIWQVDLNNSVFDTIAAILTIAKLWVFVMIGLVCCWHQFIQKSHYLSKKTSRKKPLKSSSHSMSCHFFSDPYKSFSIMYNLVFSAHGK